MKLLLCSKVKRRSRKACETWRSLAETAVEHAGSAKLLKGVKGGCRRRVAYGGSDELFGGADPGAGGRRTQPRVWVSSGLAARRV